MTSSINKTKMLDDCDTVMSCSITINLMHPNGKWDWANLSHGRRPNQSIHASINRRSTISCDVLAIIDQQIDISINQSIAQTFSELVKSYVVYPLASAWLINQSNDQLFWALGKLGLDWLTCIIVLSINQLINHDHHDTVCQPHNQSIGPSMQPSINSSVNKSASDN